MEAELLSSAVQRLREGGLVAFPTETVYGLGADALNARAVARVFEVKGRPAHNPLIVHVTGLDMARALVAPGAFDDRAVRLARAFWPGPLSIVLPRASHLPGAVTAGGPNVALRCPDHPVALALLYAFGGPLVGPSANPSGRVSPTCAQHVIEAFAHDQVLTLDGGACATGIESTVVSLAGPQAQVLRPGVIGAEQIAHALGQNVGYAPHVQAPPAAGAGVPLTSPARALDAPGLLASHYAPRARCVLIDDLGELEELAHDVEPGASIALLSHSLLAADAATSDRASGVRVELIELPHEAPAYAAMLYAALRHADAQSPALIAVHAPPRTGETPAETAIWRAVHDRLSRASA